MQFRTYVDLNRTIIDNLYKIPKDVDLIVGVPRSGMMAALTIGLYLNLPVTSADNFLAGNITSSGTTKPKNGWISSLSDTRRILVVEDSVATGTSLNQIRESIEAISPYAARCTYMAIYVVPDKTDVPDFYFEVVDSIRIFQWNFLTHSLLAVTCFDIDGVLCYDPTDVENDDGEEYKKFLRNATVKLKPLIPVGYIVTSRLEKYRAETEWWLNNNGIKFGELYMMNVATAEERQKNGNHADFKANVYKKLKRSKLFIESDDGQARRIFELTNKPVFCIDSQQYYSDERREAITQEISHKKVQIKATIARIRPIYQVYKYWQNRIAFRN